MISSFITFRLKRLSALSRLSPSCKWISAKGTHLGSVSDRTLQSNTLPETLHDSKRKPRHLRATSAPDRRPGVGWVFLRCLGRMVKIFRTLQADRNAVKVKLGVRSTESAFVHGG